MVQDRAVVTMAHQQKVVHNLSNGAIFSDLELSHTHISRSGHSLTLNISEMATVIIQYVSHTAIHVVTMECE